MITLNITGADGTLLGQIKISRVDLRAARSTTAGAMALVDDICTEAGIR